MRVLLKFSIVRWNSVEVPACPGRAIRVTPERKQETGEPKCVEYLMFGHNQDEIIALIGNGIGAKVDIARNRSIQAGFRLTGPSKSIGCPTKALVC